jgi:curved DNA-binding protein
VQYQDYYETLGVARDASREQIQRAYRKLARELHPDVNKAADAEPRFKAVTEAYEVLKDPDKRKRYDALGRNWRAGQEFTPPPGWEGARFDFGGRTGDFEDLGDGFSSFFEAFFGGAGPFGGGFGGGRASRPQRPRRGATQEVEITLSLKDLMHGGTKEFVLESQTVGADARPLSTRRTYSVRIPPGTREGTTIRLAGQGGGGALGGPPGDLLLHVRLAPHPRLAVEGADDLAVDVPVAPWEAALGAKVSVPLLEGEATLSVPAGTSSGTRLRLRGQGLPRRDGSRGDLLAVVQVALPRTLTDEERELYERLARSSPFRPRG